MALITGWDRSTWNSGTWNSPVPVEVTGVSAASAVGSTTITIAISFSVTGVSATSVIGTPYISLSNWSVIVKVDGVSATSIVNQATVWGIIDTSQTPSWTKIAA